MKVYRIFIIIIIFSNVNLHATIHMRYPNALNQQAIHLKKEPDWTTHYIPLQNIHLDKTKILIEQLFSNTTVKIAPNRNELIIKTPKTQLPHIKKMLKQINQTAETVTVSVQIIELSQQASTTLEPLINPTDSHILLNTQQKTLIPTTELVTLLNHLETTGDAQLKATPTLTIQNNNSASLHIGDLIPYITHTTTATSEYTSLKQLPTGIKITITPTITAENIIKLTINCDIAMIKVWKTIHNNQYPVLSSRTINTHVSIPNNTSLVIAGLLDEHTRENISYNKIINKIPLIKRFFQKKVTESIKSDIYIIVTPRIKTH